MTLQHVGLSLRPDSSTMNASSISKVRIKDDEDIDGNGENVDVELAKLPTGSDLDKMAKMKSILSQFTDDRMSRYESFSRSALQKPNMRRVLLLVSITESQKISLPMTIVVCGIARMLMPEQRESGPIRHCHIREA